MQYDIRMYKIVCGDVIMGIYDGEAKAVKDVVIIQAVPSANGIQIALIPYGFPYEDEIRGSIEEKHFVYEYKKVPQELKDKYLETKSNIKITSSLDGINSSGNSGIIL